MIVLNIADNLFITSPMAIGQGDNMADAGVVFSHTFDEGLGSSHNSAPFTVLVDGSGGTDGGFEVWLRAQDATGKAFTFEMPSPVWFDALVLDQASTIGTMTLRVQGSMDGVTWTTISNDIAQNTNEIVRWENNSSDPWVWVRLHCPSGNSTNPRLNSIYFEGARRAGGQ